MSTRSKVWVFPLLLIFYEFAVNLSNDMYLPGLPSLAKDLDIGPALAQLTISFWLAGSALSQFFLGPLSDYRGRRFVLLGGGIIFLLSALGCCLSNRIEWLLLFRFLQGSAVCSLMVAGYASIHEIFSDEEAIRVLSWMGSAAIVAPMAGPLFGGWVISWGEWRAVFAVLCILGLFPLLGLWTFMPETNQLRNEKKPRLKAVVVTYSRLFRNSSFILSALSSGLLYSGIMVWLTCSSFLLIDKLGVSESVFGIVQIPIFSSYVGGAWIMRKFLNQSGSQKLIRIGLLSSLLSSLGFFWVTSMPELSLTRLIIPMMGYSFGVGLSSAPLNRITFSSTNEAKGAASAIFYFCMVGTGSIASALISWLYTGTATSVAGLILIVSILAKLLNVVRGG